MARLRAGRERGGDGVWRTGCSRFGNVDGRGAKRAGGWSRWSGPDRWSSRPRRLRNEGAEECLGCGYWGWEAKRWASRGGGGSGSAGRREVRVGSGSGTVRTRVQPRQRGIRL
jgi:hypothetical protein